MSDYLRFHQVRIKYGSNASDTVTGILLYPDDFSFSEAGVASLPFGASNSVTELLATDWEALESAGCVFLPSTGTRSFATDGSPSFSSANVGQNAHYWSSSSTAAGTAHATYFNISGKALTVKNAMNRYVGLPVRLVQDVGKPVEQRYYSATIGGACDYVWDLGDKSLTVHRNKAGNEVFRDTLRSSLSGCDSLIRVLSLSKVLPITFDTAVTTYGTTYTFTHAGISTSKTWNLADSSHLYGVTKAYMFIASDGACDTGIIRLKLTRALAAFTVASGRKVGFSPANLSSSAFANSTTEYGGYLSWASTYGNVAITEGKSSYSANAWRMLTSDEWTYLFNSRSVSHRRYDFATVNSVNGVILYPDSYTPASAGVGSVSPGGTVSSANWNKMLAVGCVFLPCAGFKSGSSVSNAGSYGFYWSSTTSGPSGAYNATFNFSSKSVNPTSGDTRTNGMSVRLVRNL